MKLNIVQEKMRGWFSRNRYTLTAFGLTYIALIIFAIARGLAPFGAYSLLSIDLHGQYYPMMLEKLSHPFSVWSWDGALGFSSAAQSAYYTNSLFIWLLAPFQGYARIAVLDLTIFLKLALSASFFTYYLEEKHERKSFFGTVFGVAYGLSAYMTSFISQPMWLDVVLLLPLILNGFDRMMAGKGPFRYTLLLALAIFSNFYISISLCIFLALWFIFAQMPQKPFSWRQTAVRAGRFAGFSLLAGMLAAVTLLPLLANMENWHASSLSFSGEFEFYHSFSEFAEAFAFGRKASREYGVGNLFCGSASIFFSLLYLLNREIPLRERLPRFALLLFLAFSFELNLLDYIWHGLHFPNQLPARQSYLFIFLILALGYESLIHRHGLDISRLFVSFLLSAGFLATAWKTTQNLLGISISTLVLISVLVLLIIVIKGKDSLRRSASWVLSLLLLSEIWINGVCVLDAYAGATNALDYISCEADMRRLTKKYESRKNDFYRSEVSPNFTFNTGQLYGIKGVTYYSSTMNTARYALFKNLGNRIYAQNVSTVYQPTPMQDMMFGMKYHYMRLGEKLPYGKLIEKTETVSVYESPYALPVAYAVSPAIKEFMTVSVEEPTVYEGIALQTKFVSLATGLDRDVAVEAVSSQPILQNARLDGNILSVRDTDSEASYSVEFYAQCDGYFYIDFDFVTGTYTAFVNGAGKRTGTCAGDPLLSMGYVKKGDSISVTVTVKGYQAVFADMSGWIVDEKALDAAHETLSAGGLHVERASETRIIGTIAVSEDSVLYSSIPYENGWTVYIDGEKQKTYDLGAGLLACDIAVGTHTVEYRYLAPGLVRGILLTLSSVAILACLWFTTAKRRKNAQPNV
jgi:uncharacterized membrane protein YfhO